VAGWLADWLTGWLAGWLAGWPAGRLAGRLASTCSGAASGSVSVTPPGRSSALVTWIVTRTSCPGTSGASRSLPARGRA
jgi:hypothetical protein